MAPTIKEIAEKSGVSRGTVDRALNGRGGVNPEVERRIKRVAEEMMYKPNMVARALSSAKKCVKIGVIINSKDNPFFDKVMQGLSAAMSELAEFYVLVSITELGGYDVKEQIAAIENYVAEGVNAIVITAINNKSIKDRLNQLADQGVELVTLNSDASGVNRLCFVGCDDVKSGKTAGELISLIVANNTQVGIVTGSNSMLGHTKRIEGFKQVIKDCSKNITIADIVQGFDDDKITYEKTKEMLENNNDITALYFCAGGIDGGIKAVEEQLAKRAITVITVDDTDIICKHLKSGIITLTVCQQPFKQGYDSLKLAFRKLIEDKIPPKKHMYTHVEVKTKYNI